MASAIDVYKKQAGVSGSAAGVTVNTADQQTIKDQMNANSRAWLTADAATRKQLEAENQRLGAQLGGTVSFDPNTGTWSGSAQSGVSGSAAGVNVYTDDQQAVKDQMNANSRAWQTADDATKKQLEAENQRLGAQLGGTVSFDPKTGTWSGSASIPVPQGSSLTGQVEDYSDYLEQMYAARKDSALAQLQAAYESNLAALDRAGEGIAGQYQDARNSAAGASEQAKRSFAEYAAASGLNSGTGGQAELARNVTLQNNLNSINTAQADAVSDLELQRANAETEYSSAIAQAEAEGDYALASALYQEKVRVQDTLIELEARQQQMDLQRYQLQYQAQRDEIGDRQYADQFAYQQQRDQVSDQQWQDQFNEAVRQNDIATALSLLSQLGTAQGSVADTLGIAQGTPTAAQQQWTDSFAFQQQQYADSLAQNQKSTLAEYGSAFLNAGVMPSAEMLSAMGITASDAQGYINAVKAQQAAASAVSRSSGSSSGSSGGSSSGSTASVQEDYDGLYAAAYASQNAQNYIASHYKEYGFTSSAGLYAAYQDWRENGAAENGQKLYINDFSTLVGYSRKVLNNAQTNRGLDAQGSTEYLYSVLKNQGYGDAVISQVLAALGL